MVNKWSREIGQGCWGLFYLSGCGQIPPAGSWNKTSDCPEAAKVNLLIFYQHARPNAYALTSAKNTAD